MTGAPVVRRQPVGWTPGDLTGTRVLVVGLGTFGGGLGASRFLLGRGATVTVTDLRSEEALGDAPQQLRDAGARLVLGRHDASDLEAADWLVASPAVPLGSEFLQEAARRGVPVETELSLLCRLLPGPWIGITGTNGKSSTAQLTARLLESAGRRVHQGGNSGGSLLDGVDRFEPTDAVVLEVSSFQLEHLGAIGLAPDVAVVTNLTPDHLDRHGSFEAYAKAKRSLLRGARVAVLNRDDPTVRTWADESCQHVLWCGGDRKAHGVSFHGTPHTMERWVDGSLDHRVTWDAPALIGPHQQANLAAACAAVHAYGAAFDRCGEVVATTGPLPSRLHELSSVGDVRFVDDGVATSPPAVAAALRSYDATIHLLAGGYDKGIDPGPLLEALAERRCFAYLFGAAARALARRLEAGGIPELRQADRSGPRWRICGTVGAAFDAARRRAQPGEVVLLSPGYASYDQFRNFEERAALFRRLVEQSRRLERAGFERGQHAGR